MPTPITAISPELPSTRSHASAKPLRHLSTHKLEAEVASIRIDSTFKNWAGTYACTPQSIFYAETEYQIRCLVALALRKGKKLRAFGAGHSPSDLVCVTEQDWLVNLDALNKLIEVDTDKKTATVQAGIRLRDVHPILRKHGLALSSLGSISDQSLAGAISTATHGSSCQFGNLSTIVRAMTIIIADDDVYHLNIDPKHDPELFQASLCGLGMTGIITQLTIQCESAFNLEEEVFSMKTNAFISSLADGREGSLPESAEHVRAWWHPQAGEVRVSRMNRTSKSATTRTSSILDTAKDWLRDRLLGFHWHQVGLLVGRVFPNFLTWHARFLYFKTQKPGCILDTAPLKAVDGPRPEDPSYPRCSATTSRIDASVAIFNYDCLFPQYTYEGVVPIERTAACLGEMQEWLEGEMSRTGGMRHHFPIEVRFSAEDDVWMSPTNGMRGCYLGIVQYKPYGLPVSYRRLFTRFEEILFAHEGKPHWAKSHTVGPETLVKMFPRTPEFLRVCKRADPKGIFLNPYARRHFFGDIDRDTAPARFKSTTQSLEDKLKLQ